MIKNKQSRLITTILDSVADGVFTIDNNRVLTSFNRAAEKIIGIKREKAIGQYCYNIFHADICNTGCALEKTLKTGREIINLQINVLNNNGKRMPVSVSTAVLKDEKNNIVGGVETFRDLSAIYELKKELSKQYTFEDIISKNSRIQNIFNILPDIADSESTVLIEGASGSGKELFARAIHNLSKRKKKPYIVVNCAALPDTLLESELFGYLKGAFTDARKDKPGRFALAEGGTIFLDEIGSISTALQVKLLRILQEKEYEPLGAISPLKSDVRVISATNKNLAQLVQEDKFRDDLYYRLNVVKIELPTLSERREDIPLLAEHFINRFNLKKNKNIQKVSDEVLGFLMQYDFPGNIRELENIIEHAFVLCRGQVIEFEHLPKELINKTELMQKQEKYELPAKNQLKDAEANVIIEALKRNNGHRDKTAKELHIDKSTLWRKMKKLGIEHP
ncbi:MAG: Fis family transcriptional regulator [Elusimicrobia bacterium CG1_02_37_114]|nr:MAG: Fis family transcriptional regulator [Elusimicrobia bacterium CG1_02_37_114]PIZ13756.1 MAG: Fis family transcriptional regulator [Elusimicrobia bacterium CG_4_10_14_0_8_um_filter_37_32]